ncbi:MAG: isochorismate synthase, partial [Opitutae bacterium]|nr:isochorismate synthase [Opitutae bacterium]
MEIIPESSPPQRDRESLVRFLEYCRRRAIELGRPQYASISLRVKHISPLAVLQSIFEPDASHFYLEKPGDGEAVAGAEAVWEQVFSGPSRFTDAQEATQAVL